jgi:hypothetical protein
MMGEIAENLASESAVDEQIDRFIDLNGLKSGTPISVAVDAMAMNEDGSTLPAKCHRHIFVVYGQPLDRT